MKKMLLCLSAVVCFLSVQVASAQITRVRTDSYPVAEVPGFVVNDILIDFYGQYTGSQMLIELDQGHLYFDEFGAGFGPQNAAFRTLAPSLEWHSIIALGTDSSSISNGDATTGPWGNPNVNGNAVDLGSTAASESFGPSLVDIAWGPGGTNPVLDQNGFLVARITLSEDANGYFSYLASAGGEVWAFGGSLLDGRLCPGIWPEPTSLMLVGVATMGLAYVRRRE